MCKEKNRYHDGFLVRGSDSEKKLRGVRTKMNFDKNVACIVTVRGQVKVGQGVR